MTQKVSQTLNGRFLTFRPQGKVTFRPQGKVTFRPQGALPCTWQDLSEDERHPNQCHILGDLGIYKMRTCQNRVRDRHICAFKTEFFQRVCPRTNPNTRELGYLRETTFKNLKAFCARKAQAKSLAPGRWAS